MLVPSKEEIKKVILDVALSAQALERNQIIYMIERLIEKHDDVQTALARQILASIKSRK